VHAKTREPLTVGGIEKMSKSKRNVVDPEAIIESYGADTARWFMLSDTPPERDIEWTEEGIEGAWRFVQRVWRLIHDIARKAPVDAVEPKSPTGAVLELRRATHRSLAAMTGDLTDLRFNRAIARIYELANALTAALQAETVDASLAFALREAGEAVVLMFAPMMPHFAEECWQVLGRDGLVAEQAWPKSREEFVRSDEVIIAVQVDGKRRDEIRLPKGLPSKAVEDAVLKLDNVNRALTGRQVIRFVYVPDRVANVVSSFIKS
jgi:leucyl-tRNA synthetase